MMKFTIKSFNKVLDFVNNLRENDELNDLFNQLISYGDCLLIGQSVKDIGIHEKKFKDLDIVIITDEEIELSLSENLITTKNKYGEIKLIYEMSEISLVLDVMTRNSFEKFYKDLIRNNYESLYVNLSDVTYSAYDYNNSISRDVSFN